MMKGVLCSAFVLWACTTSFVAAGCSGDLKISSQADLDAIRSCQIYKGTLTVDQSAATQLKLDGVTMLEGDLVIMNNEGLSKLSLPKLQSINGAFKLENNKALNGLDMPMLSALKSFQVAVHPALPAIAFPAGLAQAEKIAISDTTVTKVDGLSLSKLSELVIDNNIYLRSMDLSHLSEVSNSLIISANSPSLSLDFSAVKSIQDGSFRNLAGISLSGLNRVGGDISFISNTFDSLEMSNITEIGGTLTISNNKKLGKLSIPELTRLGGALSVGDNTQLSLVDAFQHLEEVDGTVDLTGSFDEIQLPKLSDVRGGMNIQTTSEKFKCDDMGKLKNGVIKGNSFVCKARVSNPKSGLSGKNGEAGGSDGESSGATQLTQSVTMALLVALVTSCL